MIDLGLSYIDRGIDILEQNDPYGDLDENFKELDKETRITTRVKETIELLEGRKIFTTK